MRNLIKYLRGYEKETVLAPLFKMFEACLELLVPLVVARIIDVGIQNADARVIWQQCGLLVLLAAVGLGCSLTAQYFSAKSAYGFGTVLRAELFRHINSLSYTELDRLGTPRLVTRMTSDINQVQNGLNLTLRLLLRSPFIVVGALIMAFAISPKISAIFLVATLGIGLVVWAIMRATVPVYRRAQNKLDEVTLLTRENYAGARVVRAFSRQGDEMAAFAGANDTLKTIQLHAGRVSAMMNPLTYLIVNLGIIAVLLYGGREVNTGSLTQGQVIALINYMGQILASLLRIADLVISITRALASAARISEVFEIPCGMPDTAAAPPAPLSGAPAVSFEQVAFTYAGSAAPSLEEITFSVREGETIGIIGGTGSGKTTLIELLCRLYDTTAGKVLLYGQPIAQYPLALLRQWFGIVPQRAVLFTGSIRDNLRWARADAPDSELWRALEVAQADEVVRAKTGGLDAPVETGGRNFSGGQRQRLTIARALVGSPRFLILDDSSSALDYATDARLRTALRDKTGGTTVFLVSQRVAAVRHADQILVLSDGRLAGVGTHAALLENCEEYREICLSQLTREEVAKTL